MSFLATALGMLGCAEPVAPRVPAPAAPARSLPPIVCPGVVPPAVAEDAAPTAPLTVVPAGLISKGERHAGELAWNIGFDGGHVMLYPDGVGGVLVVPSFLGATMEGDTLGRFSPSGRVVWSKRARVTGYGDGGALPGGSAALPAVVPLDWPKTEDAYGTSEIHILDSRGNIQSIPLGGVVTEAQIATGSDGSSVMTGVARAPLKIAGPSFKPTRTSPQRFILSLGPHRRARFIAPIQGDYVLQLAVSPEGSVSAVTASYQQASLVRFDARGAEIGKWELPSCMTTGSFEFAPDGGFYAASFCSFANGLGYELSKWSPEAEIEWAVDARAADDQSEAHRSQLHVSPGGVTLVSGTAVVTYDTDGKQLTQIGLDRLFASMNFAGAVATLNDGRSIYVADITQGDRIGTMLNSLYSRAYGRAFTYLRRHDLPTP
ncbi:MAG: hypothetical protein HOW73_34165 [Polyangiaceae bacterium]|nr:hypothetical protein [Polyangiaceae bacterium]